MPSALPSPVTRLLRNRLLFVGILLSSGVAVSTGGVAERASVRIQGEIDANWRGAYDILVRPPGGRLDLEATNGLVEPNFLGFSGAGGITLVQLDAVRKIDNVELAAPVAVVGYVGYVVTAPIVHLSTLPEQPTFFELRVDEYSSDGVRDVPIRSSTGHIVLGPSDLSSPDLAFRTDLRDLSWGTDGVDVTMPTLPPVVSPLIAVDPIAEQALLGPTGRFLAPLSELDGAAPLTVETFDLGMIPNEFQVDVLSFAALRKQGGEVTKRPVVPLVVSERMYGSLSLRLEVTQLGETLGVVPSDTEFAQMLTTAHQATRASVGTSTITIDEVFRPFQAPSLMLLWPGSSPPSGTIVDSNVDRSFALRLALRPTYRQLANAGGATFEIASTGPVDPVGEPFSSGGQAHEQPALTETYAETGYRDLKKMPLAVAEGFTPVGSLDRPFHFAPLGTFDLSAVELPSNPLNYVPLGAYDPPGAALVSRADGTPIDPKPMRPTLNPAGLLQAPPLAITDLVGAVTLRGDHPIDAIRVRVAGVHGYGASDQGKVERVAAAIAELGLDVDIVAGSSPQDVEIFVPDYLTGETAEDLGFVRQGWTTLGAAERVETGLEKINIALLILAMATSLVFAVGLQVLALERRSQEIAILGALGWQTPRIAGWVLGETLLGASTVLASGVIGSLLADGRLLPLMVSTALAAVLLVSAFVATVLAARRAGPISAGDVRPVSRLSVVLQVRGGWSFAARQVCAYPATSLALGAAAVAAALSLAQGVGLVASAISTTGPTLLSLELAGTLRPYQIGLVVISLAGSVVLVGACLAFDRRTRRRDDRLVAAIGWTVRESRGPVIIRAVILAIPAAAIAAALAAWLAQSIDSGFAAQLAVLAAVAASILLIAPAIPGPSYSPGPR